MALKSVQKLVSDMRQGVMSSCYGNHSFTRRNGLCYFKYHNNTVCILDLDQHTVSYSYCGYEGSPSTTRTIKSYQELFKHVTVVDREQHTRSDINNG